MSKAVNELIGRARRLLQIWEGGELEFSSQTTERVSEEERKEKVIRHPMQATRVVSLFSVTVIFISVDSERSTEYVWDDLGVTYDYCSADRTEELGAVQSLGTEAQAINAKKRNLI